MSCELSGPLVSVCQIISAWVEQKLGGPTFVRNSRAYDRVALCVPRYIHSEAVKRNEE